MENSVESQAFVFFTTVYGGIIIGFIYDLYRIFRYFFKPKKVATFIEDLVFWVLVALIALFILIFSSWGELRGYVFIGFVGGAFLYNRILSKLVITIMVKLVRLVVKVLKYIFGIIFFPFRQLAKVLYNPYRKGRVMVSNKFKRVKRILNLPRRVAKDVKKYTSTILKKK